MLTNNFVIKAKNTDHWIMSCSFGKSHLVNFHHVPTDVPIAIATYVIIITRLWY